MHGIDSSQRRKVLLIGWDAADWKVIHPLMDAGKMPALKHLVETGSSGNLASLDPPMSPIMWTSIATGMTADKHGVLGFTQPRADGKGVQPVLASSRKVKALWNIHAVGAQNPCHWLVAEPSCGKTKRRLHLQFLPPCHRPG